MYPVLRSCRGPVPERVRKKGYVHDDLRREHSNDRSDTTAIDACAAAAIAPGTFASLRSRGASVHESDAELDHRERRTSARVDDFDVHAAVRIDADNDADNDVGRQKLVRYCARPVLTLERLSVLPDGCISYEVNPRGRKTHRLMTPIEFLARLAALIPPPKYPLVRYHGVLAPNSKLRARIVPRVVRPESLCGARDSGAAPAAAPALPAPSPTPAANAAALAAPSSSATSPSAPSVLAPTPVPRHGAVMVPPAPNQITGPHLHRLLGGKLLAPSGRTPWALLMERTFGYDVLECD